ncbi:hypothetical protein UCRNP2_7796 [Neofusicoccum parvum UCRNP2]|uniref:Uncharacterized protein n=1 Tax=Botryosphaeria parva (strain UCR-NP2) TaxID=1287680 RepID=R1G274_BOTPV|nr:hypothetical protein UCRNP2_7796 [Neofusicoccum parvum UCRNP2]
MLSPILIFLGITGALASQGWEATMEKSADGWEILQTDNTAWIKTVIPEKPRCMQREQIVPPYVKVYQESCLEDGADDKSYFLPAFKFPELVDVAGGPLNKGSPHESLKYGVGTEKPPTCVPKAQSGSHGCQQCVAESTHQTLTIEACPILDDYFYPDEVAKQYAKWWISRKQLS